MVHEVPKSMETPDKARFIFTAKSYLGFRLFVTSLQFWIFWLVLEVLLLGLQHYCLQEQRLVLWKTHVYRAFKIYSLPQRRLKCCFFPYPGIDKNVIEYISAEGVAEEANIINSRAKYFDFLFSGTHEFSRQMCGPGFPMTLSVWMTHFWLF